MVCCFLEPNTSWMVVSVHRQIPWPTLGQSFKGSSPQSATTTCAKNFCQLGLLVYIQLYNIIHTFHLPITSRSLQTCIFWKDLSASSKTKRIRMVSPNESTEANKVKVCQLDGTVDMMSRLYFWSFKTRFPRHEASKLKLHANLREVALHPSRELALNIIFLPWLLLVGVVPNSWKI